MNLSDRLKITTVNILSIDGGGIRGLIPAMVLEQIEKQLRTNHKNTSLHKAFDLIAGTSTGALITLGLSCPQREDQTPVTIETNTSQQPEHTVTNIKTETDKRKGHKKKAVLTAEELVSFYREHGPKIFPQRGSVLQTRLIQAFRNRYPDEYMKDFFYKIFGEATLKDALTNILITSYDTEHREPRFFKKRPSAPEWEDDLNFCLKDVARAAVAAPTFFSPAYIHSIPDDGKRYSLIDGGIYANNPSMCAYIEAKKIFPNARKYRILSLGTGTVDKPFPYAVVKNWGYIDWMSATKGVPLLDMIADGQSDSTIHMLNLLDGVEHHRIDFLLDEKHAFMDDASKTNLDYLTSTGISLVQDHMETIENFGKWL